jgi:3-deoxy-D-arabino-heptulosonate 7-phosphate (DAHP) synthase class II
MEKHVHVDKWALGIVEQLRQIETTEKMADKIDVLMYYLDASGLTDKAKKAQRLDLGDSAHRQPPPAAKNVTPIRQQAAE